MLGVDGSKRRRRTHGKGIYNKARALWYAQHRAIRFAKRFGK